MELIKHKFMSLIRLMFTNIQPQTNYTKKYQMTVVHYLHENSAVPMFIVKSLRTRKFINNINRHAGACTIISFPANTLLTNHFVFGDTFKQKCFT